jgi:CheY-like chemotaxis protein
VKTYAGAKSALSQLKNEIPGAIFVDVSLPEKHVSMLFEELRRLEETKDVPLVVFAPSMSREELGKAAERWGARHLITSAGELGDVFRKIKESSNS